MKKNSIILSVLVVYTLISCSVDQKVEKNEENKKEVTNVTSSDTLVNCSEQDLAFLDSVKAGNLEALKTFIENGGNPMFECYNRTLPGKRLSRLVTRINLSNSYEMLEYYLTQDITAEWKEILLNYQTTNRNDKSVKLLVQNNAREEKGFDWCIPLDTNRYNYLLKFEYDVNFMRPSDSTTDLMHYAECPCPNGADEIIESMKFLVKNGADHTIETNSGKKAIDFATHPDIIAYLSSL